MLTCEDRDTVNRVWSGQIPVCFKLAEQDCSSIEVPDPFFIMLPRISYLPFIWEKVQRYFSSYVAEEFRSSQLWLETPINPASILNGSVMLRWHLPIGLLYDLHGGGTLPWTIIVHFRDFPDKELIPCETKQVAEAQFMNSVKEADFLKTRKKIMTAMTQGERRQMTAALYALQAESFWAVNRKLMFTSEPWKHVPLRVFLSQSPPSTAMSAGRPPVVQQLQKLVLMAGSAGGSPDDSSKPFTLRNVLRQWLKTSRKEVEASVRPQPLEVSKHTEKGDGAEHQNRSSAVEDEVQNPSAEGSPTAGTPAKTKSVNNDAQVAEEQAESNKNDSSHAEEADPWGDNMEVIIHGIPAPLDVPLHWLAINMSYADNFLYVVIRQRKQASQLS